jgi:peptidoglycan hydrolase-like protein with peptidoglycan-binding domain
MAEPQIKSRLESPEFTTQPSPKVQKQLQDCLNFDPAHIQPNDHGDHVKVIQDVLEILRQRLPDLGLLKIEKDKPGVYGEDTIKAVRRYKEINGIIRSGQPLDAIVGRMTITQMDNDLVNGPPLPGPPKPVVINAPVEIAASSPAENLAKDDLTFDFRAVPKPSGNSRIFEFRSKSTAELEGMMVDDLRKGHEKFGPGFANDFFKNTTRPSADFAISHGAGSEFSNFVAKTGVWRALALDFRKDLDKQIKRLGANGPFSPLLLKNQVDAPLPSWSPSGKADALAKGLAIVGGLNTEDGTMLVLVGSFQASRVFLSDFAMDPATRQYTGTLFYQLVDHFGVDTSDTERDIKGHGTDSQVAFWVLQHERHNPGHMPYRLKVVIREDIEGSF